MKLYLNDKIHAFTSTHIWWAYDPDTDQGVWAVSEEDVEELVNEAICEAIQVYEDMNRWKYITRDGLPSDSDHVMFYLKNPSDGSLYTGIFCAANAPGTKARFATRTSWIDVCDVRCWAYAPERPAVSVL